MPEDPTFTQAQRVNSEQTNSAAGPSATTLGKGIPTVSFTPPVAADRYALGDEMARGGMGVVYRGTDTLLGREVAIKVLQEKFCHESGAARRFADEARITGQLQHPAIPPVHDLGSLSDGRLFLAMKLIKGETLSRQLAARPNPAAERGRFLAVFEQVCQALAFAHDRNVIHRDLKPANIMVGNFGEVQVMDWGLAKVLSASRDRDGMDNSDETAAATNIHSLRDSDASFTQAGSVLGTPAFMPPEQAVGAIGKIGTRSDVFGLGAILAVILTGKPPFAATSAETTRVKAAQGDVDECFARLDICGADPGLVELCKRCLSPKPINRPKCAGEVAVTVATLRADADDRARRAELERARAELRAAEQRRRRRVQFALAAAIGLLLLSGGAFAWWRDHQFVERAGQQARNIDAIAALLDSCELSLQAGDAERADLALEEAERRAAEWGQAELKQRSNACRADLSLLRELNAIDQFRWTPSEDKLPQPNEIAARIRLALAPLGITPGGSKVDEIGRRVTASLLGARLVAALDRWLRIDPTVEVRGVLRIADPDPYRDAMRDAFLAKDDKKVVELTARRDALSQPPEFAALLGENRDLTADRARKILQAALVRWPNHLALVMSMGETYPGNQRDTAEERIRWYQTAVGLAPRNAAARNNLGNALQDTRDVDGAIACYREAIRLDPKNVSSHSNLGWALYGQGDVAGAIACYREAIRLDAKNVGARGNLGIALRANGDLDGAVAAYREAIAQDPELPQPHFNLAIALHDKGDYDGAVIEFREAARLAPTVPRIPNNLASTLKSKGDLRGAVEAYREAIRLDPKYAIGHNNLARMLATGPDGVRQGKQAVEHAIRACELTDWKGPDYLDTLAAAYAEAGDFDKAVEYQKRALSFSSFEKLSGRQVRERLFLYMQKKPYRDPALQPREVAPPPRSPMR